MKDYREWQALLDELLLFPEGEHDDYFDGLQTMVDGAINQVGRQWLMVVA